MSGPAHEPDPPPLEPAAREAFARERAAVPLAATPAVAQPTAIFTGGQPGSGKSTIVRYMGSHFERQEQPAVVIDPDELRPRLPYMESRIAKGNLDIPAAAYVDAGTAAARVMELAAEGQRNIVYDGTLASAKYPSQSIELLKALNYKVEIHAMAVNPDLSHASTYARREQQIADSPTKFGRGVGDDFHDSAVSGLVETIAALQKAGKVDAIVLHSRSGVIGSVRLEGGRYVPDADMAEALRQVQQNPDRASQEAAAMEWTRAAAMMRGRGADPAEQQKVEGFRDAAVAKVRALDPSAPAPAPAPATPRPEDRAAARVFRDRKTSPAAGIKLDARLAGGYQMIETMAVKVRADGLPPQAQTIVLDQQRERIARHIEQGQFPGEQAVSAAQPDRDIDR